MAGQSVNITTQFGITNGPSYSGTTTIAPATDGNQSNLYDIVVTGGSSTPIVVDPDALVSTGRFAFLGFKATATATATGTPTCTVHLTHALNGSSTDVTLSIPAGQAIVLTTAPAYVWTQITVVPDATSGNNIELFGILVVQNA